MAESFRAETNYPTNQMNIKELITPKLEDGQCDQRFIGLASQIQENISQSTINELSELWTETNRLENRYERSGLRFVIGMFQVEMEKWQRSAFKKTIRESLLRFGFKKTRVSKLLAAGEYVAGYIPFNYNPDLMGPEKLERKDHDDHLIYLRGYGVTALYLLSGMDWNGQRYAKEHFDKVGKRLSTREMEALKQKHPKWGEFKDRQSNKSFKEKEEKLLPETSQSTPTSIDTPCLVIDDLTALQPAVDAAERTTEDMVIELVTLAQSIDWQAVQDSPTLQELLTPVSNQMMLAAHLAVTEKHILQ